MTNLDSILKSKDITLPTKVHLVKATVFPVVVYRCESWIIKKAEGQRIDAFELWCWRRLSRVQARSNLEDLCKEIQPVHPKANQSWIFPGRTDAEAKAPILWPPDAKSWVTVWRTPPRKATSSHVTSHKEEINSVWSRWGLRTYHYCSITSPRLMDSMNECVKTDFQRLWSQQHGSWEKNSKPFSTSKCQLWPK